jgi:hypothetical protein
MSNKDLTTAYEIIESVGDEWGILPNRQRILFDFFAEEIRIGSPSIYFCRSISKALFIPYEELFSFHPYNLHAIINEEMEDVSEWEDAEIRNFAIAHIIRVMSFVAVAVTGHPFPSFNYTEYIQQLHPTLMEELKELCDMENDKKMERASRVSSSEDDEDESEDDDESSCYVDTESESGYSGEDESEDDESDEDSDDDESVEDSDVESENDEDDAMSLDLDTNETIRPVRPRFDGIRVMLC